MDWGVFVCSVSGYNMDLRVWVVARAIREPPLYVMCVTLTRHFRNLANTVIAGLIRNLFLSFGGEILNRVQDDGWCGSG